VTGCCELTKRIVSFYADEASTESVDGMASCFCDSVASGDPKPPNSIVVGRVTGELISMCDGAAFDSDCWDGIADADARTESVDGNDGSFCCSPAGLGEPKPPNSMLDGMSTAESSLVRVLEV